MHIMLTIQHTPAHPPDAATTRSHTAAHPPTAHPTRSHHTYTRTRTAATTARSHACTPHARTLTCTPALALQAVTSSGVSNRMFVPRTPARRCHRSHTCCYLPINAPCPHSRSHASTRTRTPLPALACMHAAASTRMHAHRCQHSHARMPLPPSHVHLHPAAHICSRVFRLVTSTPAIPGCSGTEYQARAETGTCSGERGHRMVG